MGFFKKLKQSLFGSFRSSRPKKAKAKPKQKKARKTLRAPKKRKPATKKAISRKIRRTRPTRLKKAEGIFVGTVTHYFPKVRAAAVKVEKISLTVGDRLIFRGKKGEFRQVLNSLQISRIPVESARRGEEVGIEVKQQVREGDKVFKV